MPVILGATKDPKPMSNEAPFVTSMHAATGRAGGAHPATMMFMTITTTRMRGGIG
jgi:hypothetical protein